MSKVQLAGNASGTGIFTIASPNSNTDRNQIRQLAVNPVVNPVFPNKPTEQWSS